MPALFHERITLFITNRRLISKGCGLAVLLTILVVFWATGQTSIQRSLVKLDVNWPQYMANHDLVWDHLPEDYFAGAFVGNGLLGTIIFKDDAEPNTLRFEIGRTDVYDHRTKVAHAYETSRLPIGQLLLTPVGKIRRLP